MGEKSNIIKKVDFYRNRCYNDNATHHSYSTKREYYLETDRSEPTTPNIVKVADYFGVAADFLLGRIDF